jgi:hypothetical protein
MLCPVRPPHLPALFPFSPLHTHTTTRTPSSAAAPKTAKHLLPFLCVSTLVPHYCFYALCMVVADPLQYVCKWGVCAGACPVSTCGGQGHHGRYHGVPCHQAC